MAPGSQPTYFARSEVAALTRRHGLPDGEWEFIRSGIHPSNCSGGCSALTLRQRELVIDRTPALCGADYEWAVHVAGFAEKAGLDAAQLASLAAGRPADDCWDATDRAVLEAVDELHSNFDLSDDSWANLVAVRR